MAEIEEKINTENKRDYDKEPIVIKDYNMIFGLFSEIAMILTFLLIFFIYKNEIHHSYFQYFYIAIFIPLFIAPKLKFRFQSIGKRFIKFTNNEIIFCDEKEIIQNIKLENIRYVKRTISDYYHKSQEFENGLALLLAPLLIVYNYFTLLVSKLIYNLLINRNKKYMFDDAIIIFDNDGNFINVLPLTDIEYEDIVEYFTIQKNIDIRNIDFYMKILIGTEKIYEKRKK